MARKDPKARLLDKARALFWKKGYGATSMRDIAGAYGCKPSNIYNYFATKEEILFEVLREEMEDLLAPIRHLEHEEAVDAGEHRFSYVEYTGPVSELKEDRGIMKKYLGV